VVNGLTKESWLGWTAALGILFSGSRALAQPAATKTLSAHRITSAVRVDGVLDDEAWHEAEAATDFVQQDPHVGEPVSEPTEVRVLVDNEAIYFGIVCHDSDPHGVIARELRRDNAFADDDHVEILLDTFDDHRQALVFGVNPLGVQADGTLLDAPRQIATTLSAVSTGAYTLDLSPDYVYVDWLFSYRPTPGTVAFLGYGSSLVEPSAFRFAGLSRVSDGFFVKLSYLFRM